MTDRNSTAPTLGNTTPSPESISSTNDHKKHTLEESEQQLPDTSATSRDEEKANIESTPGTAEKSGDPSTQAGPPLNPSAGFPDGGLRAWLCVFGSFWCLFVSFGWINCIGVFQDYYQTELLSDLAPSTVAWIPSLESFFMFVCGPVLGRLYDNYGPRYILLVGTFLHVFGLMMTSLSTQYYQFILAQGICSAIGASSVFFPAVSSTSTWFFHKRALALGIVASGSSLGGVILPILVQKLIPIIGFPWTMRVAAFVILGALIIANLTVASRLPPARSPFKINMLYTCFTEKPFAILTIGSFFFFLCMLVPFNYLQLQAREIGMDANLASYLIPILNAASIVGRTLPGYLADKVGRFNVLCTFCYLAGIICLALWLPSAGNAPVIVFAVLYGFASGAFVSLLPAVIAQISPIKEIGIRNGNLFAAISVAALVGNPISGALVTQDGGQYHHLQIFVGVMLLAGSTVILLARVSVGGFKLNKI